MFGGRKKAKHIVVSHASGDRREAMALVAELEARGVRIWVAPRDLDPKQGAATQAHEAIRGAVAVLLIGSAAANQSKVLKNEADIAVGHVPIIPVRIEPVAPARALHSLVQGHAAYDLFGPARDAEFARLATAALELEEAPRRLRHASAQAVPASPPAPPSAPALPATGLPTANVPTTDPAADDAIAADAQIGQLGPPPPVLPSTPSPAETGTLPVNEGAPPLGHNAALRHVVGPNANAILERWREMDRTENANQRFVAGLLAGRYWLAYRKLWLPAIASSLLALLLVALAFWTDGYGSVVGTPVAVLGLIALNGAVWLRGIGIFRATAERRIERWNLPGLDGDAVADCLRRHGGASRWAPGLLVAAELAAGIGLALWLDPGYVAWLTTPSRPIAAQKLDLVDMTRPADSRTRYTFCIANPTDLTISFTLRYASGSSQDQTMGPHSRAYAFWSRSIDAPSVSFDHVLGDGSRYTDRSYGLNTARTETQSSCGGIVYAFTTDGNDVDLKLQDQPATASASPPPAS